MIKQSLANSIGKRVYDLALAHHVGSLLPVANRLD